METGFLNFHDEEHFSTMPSSSLYDQSDMLEDSESSLLDMIPDGFAHYEASDPWDAEQELNGDFATMPGPIATGARPHTKEDFHKMLNDWQEHLGSMQASDSEEIYDGIERMTTDLPGLDIYDESSFDGDNINKKLDKTQTKKSKASGKKVVGRDLPLGHFVRDETDADELMGLGAAKVSAAAAQAGNMAEDSVDDDAFRIDVEDDCIDVETVAANEQIPVLEAVDVSSLLEQFEATESVNSTASTVGHQAQLDNRLFAMATQKLNGKCPTSAMSHQNIIDALPKEVIERIKASGRKKAIPVIPAMPSKRPGRGGTRMQDAGATLSRNKLLKLVSSASLTGESIQLDHDYCTATSTASSPEVIPPTRSFYHSDASEYVRSDDRPKPPPAEKVYSRLPDYYMVLGSLGVAVPKKESDSSRKDCDSRKDSGLESGDLSDATSEESMHSAKPLRSETARPVSSDVAYLKNINIPSVVQPKNSTMTSTTTTSDKIVTINGKAISFGTLMKKVNKTLECSPAGTSVPKVEPAESAVTQKNIDKPMVSVLKRNSAADEVLVRDTLQEDLAVSVKVEPKKRKLNLLEYRSRVRVLDRVRGSCESSRASSPVTPDPQAVEEAMQEFDQHTEIMINKDGRIDEESLATLSKTLEKKAAIKQPPAATQHETFWPRLIVVTSENETKVRAEKLHRDARTSGGVRIKQEKVGANELCEDRTGLHRASENLVQPRVRDGRLKREVESVVKVDVEEPLGGGVKFERTCGADADERVVCPRPAWNEVDVVEMTVGDGFVKVEPDVDSEAVGQTEPYVDSESIEQTEVDVDSEAVVQTEPDVVDALCVEEGSVYANVEEPLEASDDSHELVISDVRSMNDDNVLVVEVGADEVQQMMVDVCSSERVEVEEISIAVEEVSGREHSKGREHNRDQDNSHAGVTRDRSRRQYRSRRTASSSSSSSSNSHTSRRKPTEPAHRNRRSDTRTRHKSRSRSPSTSSNYSSQSRSSSQSKSRSWRTSRYDCNRNRRSGSSHSQTSQQSRCSYRSRRSCRSRSPVKRGVEYQLTEREKERQVEERRVIYVGRIDEGMTKAEMRTLFETFGPIVDISVHFREHGDNYGFVTFAYKVDAYAAVEQGKKDPTLGQFDLSFGGRRAFCKTRYADLDGSRMDPDEYSYAPQRPRPRPPTSGVNFDDLLREALRSKKEVGKTKV